MADGSSPRPMDKETMGGSVGEEGEKNKTGEANTRVPYWNSVDAIDGRWEHLRKIWRDSICGPLPSQIKRKKELRDVEEPTTIASYW